MPNSPVLVTGGAGYIGSHTVRSLQATGREIVVLDSLEFGTPDAVQGTDLVVGDIADRDLVRSLCRDRGVTDVVHFAAYKSVAESFEQPERYWDNNVAGTMALVDACVSTGVERLVFSSSASVYGNPPTVPVDESAPIAPESVYAETKAMIERMLTWTARTTDLRAISLRYFNAAGASTDASIGEDWSSTTNLIPLVMRATIQHEPVLKVFGSDYPTRDGTCVRDYIHVEDLADAHVKALDHLAGGGTSMALNVGTGVGTTVREVIETTERVTGQYVPHEVVGRRPGDPAAVWASNDLARTTLGWEPERTLDDIISSAWNWFSQLATRSH